MDGGNGVKLTEIADKMETLPTLPVSYWELVRLLDDPDVSSSAVGRHIQLDQALSARLLKLVNSPFYGVARKVTSIEQAVSFLGNKVLRNLALSSSLMQRFGGDKTVSGLWVHALAAGVGAKAIGSRMGHRETEELFLCGLLHDIGKLVQFHIAPDEVKRVREICLSEGKFYWEAEKKVFETGHDELGARLLDRWNLPEVIVNTVRRQLEPDKGGDNQLECTLVHVANAIARKLECGDSWDGNLVPEVSREQLDTVNLTSLDHDELLQEIWFEVEGLSMILLHG